MKFKINGLRSSLTVLVVLISLCSYVYLNTVALEKANLPKCDLKPKIETVDTDADGDSESEAASNKDILPEVELIKRLLLLGKKILPATGAI